MCICTHTYRRSRPPLGYCTQAWPGTDSPWKMGFLSRASPASHSESNIFLKEEGVGEKKKAGVWSVVTVAFISFPPQRLQPSSWRGEDPTPLTWGGCFCSGEPVPACARECVLALGQGCMSTSLSSGLSTTNRAEDEEADSRDGDPCVGSEGKREKLKNENCKVRAGWREEKEGRGRGPRLSASCKQASASPR